MKFAIISLLAVTVNAAYQCTLSTPKEIDDGLYLSQYMNPGDQTVTIELMYNGTTWLGIGRSEGTAMIGADAVIGRVDIPNSSTNPGKYYLSAESASGVNLVDNQSLVNASVTVDSNGYTTLRFTKYLNENGEHSITGSDDTWIYAVGSTSGDATYPKYHDIYGSVSLTLTPCTLVSDATPAPVSPAPVSPAPVSPAPVSPAPVSPAPVSPAPVSPAPVATPAPVPATTPASPTMSPASRVSGTNTGGDGDDGEESGEGNGDGDGDDGEESGEGGEESGEGGDNDGDNAGGNENQGTDENDNGSSTSSGGSGNLNAGGASVNAGSSNGSSSAAPSTISRATASLLLVMLMAVLGM